MPSNEQTVFVKMEPEKIFSIISDFEGYPKFMDNVKKVTIISGDDQQPMSEWIAELDGRIFRWVEKDIVKPEENRIEFELVEGDLKAYGGFWQLKPMEDGTEVTLNVYLELGIPMLATLLNPIVTKKLKENVSQMLNDLRTMAENS